MSLLGSKHTLNRPAKASGARWCGGVLKKVLDFEVAGRRVWATEYVVKRKVEEHIDQLELKKEDAIDRAKWRDVFTNFQETLGESGHLRKRRQKRISLSNISFQREHCWQAFDQHMNIHV